MRWNPELSDAERDDYENARKMWEYLFHRQTYSRANYWPLFWTLTAIVALLLLC